MMKKRKERESILVPQDVLVFRTTADIAIESGFAVPDVMADHQAVSTGDVLLEMRGKGEEKRERSERK